VGNDKRKKQYKDGYTHLPTNLDIKDWDYVYQIHKNNNGTHFDLRLYCPSDSESVFSFSAKHNVLDRNFPTPLRRNRDHTQDTLTFEGTFQSKKGKTNTLATIESGEATLIDIDKTGMIFETEKRIFRLKHISGKKYAYVPVYEKLTQNKNYIEEI